MGGPGATNGSGAPWGSGTAAQLPFRPPTPPAHPKQKGGNTYRDLRLSSSSTTTTSSANRNVPRPTCTTRFTSAGRNDSTSTVTVITTASATTPPTTIPTVDPVVVLTDISTPPPAASTNLPPPQRHTSCTRLPPRLSHRGRTADRHCSHSILSAPSAARRTSLESLHSPLGTAVSRRMLPKTPTTHRRPLSTSCPRPRPPSTPRSPTPPTDHYSNLSHPSVANPHYGFSQTPQHPRSKKGDPTGVTRSRHSSEPTCRQQSRFAHRVPTTTPSRPTTLNDLPPHSGHATPRGTIPRSPSSIGVNTSVPSGVQISSLLDASSAFPSVLAIGLNPSTHPWGLL
jgi:hypothetical protein